MNELKCLTGSDDSQRQWIQNISRRPTWGPVVREPVCERW